MRDRLKRYWPSVVTVLAIVLVFASLLVRYWDAHLGRRVRGITTIEIVNAGGKPLTRIELVAMKADNSYERRSTAELPPGGRMPLVVQTSDLLLDVLIFDLEGETIEYRGTETASTGDILIVEIDSQGDIATRFGD